MADFTELAGNPLSDEPVLSPRTGGQCWPKVKLALHKVMLIGTRGFRLCVSLHKSWFPQKKHGLDCARNLKRFNKDLDCF